MSRQDLYPNPASASELYDVISDICLNAEDQGIDRDRVRDVLTNVRREQFPPQMRSEPADFGGGETTGVQDL